MASSSLQFSAVATLPDQVEATYRQAKKVERLPLRTKVQHVVVLGAGAAAVAGEVVVAAAGPFMPLPVTVVKSYDVPAFVGEGSLVFALSYTGNDDEVIEAAGTAAVQGARVMAITSGGRMAELAAGWNAPIVRLPKDLPLPQFAVGSMAAAMLSILEEIGLFLGASQWVDQAIMQLRERANELKEGGNFASDLAEDLAGRTLLVYSAGALGAAAAERWKQQLNELAHAPAFWGSQPEVSHNEIFGWGQDPSPLGNDVVIINLRHDEEHPSVAAHFERFAEAVEPHVGAIVEVEAAGDGELAQLLDLLMIGDFVAIHLASL